MRRDAYRPSIILWANGNEGGWNRALDSDFALHDLQRRPVIHPDEVSEGIDTTHYLSWAELDAALDPKHWKNRWRALWGELPSVMPTEILHGLYDGGHGAGLTEYWDAISNSPRGAGMFLWAFLDEAVRRVDLDGDLDAHGSYAPDGMVGPYRQPEGSYWAVREIWSPVGIDRLSPSMAGAIEFEVENRFVWTDLSEVDLVATWSRMPEPGEPGAEIVRLTEQQLEIALAPTEVEAVRVERPEGVTEADLLSLEIFDRTGRLILRKDVAPPLRTIDVELEQSAAGAVKVSEEEGRVRLASDEVELLLDRETGALHRWFAGGAELALVRSKESSVHDLLELGDAFPTSVTASIDPSARSGEAGVTVRVEAAEAAWAWTLYPSGWVRLQYRLGAGSGLDGVRLPLDLTALGSLRWSGRGPDRVWGNRRIGGRFDIWEGAPSATGYGLGTLDLSGVWADLRWLEWSTPMGTLTAIPELFSSSPPASDPTDQSGPYASFVPMKPVEDPRFTLPKVPPGLSFLHDIPSVGTKFHRPEELAPPRREVLPAAHEGTLWLHWRAVTEGESP